MPAAAKPPGQPKPSGTTTAAVNAPTPAPPAPAPPVQLIAVQTVADMPGGVGSVVAATVAPKSGFIDHPEGTPVVVVLKDFWTSKTMTWLRRTVYGAFALAFLVAFAPAIAAGNIDSLNWNDVKNTFLKAFIYTLIAALFGIFKKLDNDPVR
jgi:hypothetical protein